MAWIEYIPPTKKVVGEYNYEKWDDNNKNHPYHLRKTTGIIYGTIGDYNFVAHCVKHYSGGNVTYCELSYFIDGNLIKTKPLIKSKYFNVSSYNVNDAVWMAECWVRRELKGINK